MRYWLLAGGFVVLMGLTGHPAEGAVPRAHKTTYAALFQKVEKPERKRFSLSHPRGWKRWEPARRRGNFRRAWWATHPAAFAEMKLRARFPYPDAWEQPARRLRGLESREGPDCINVFGLGLFHGCYQMLPSTWRSVGGSMPILGSSLREQTYRAYVLFCRSNPSNQWPNTYHVLPSQSAVC